MGALLNKEREMEQENLTKEQCVEINNRYTALVEATKQIAELSSEIRKNMSSFSFIASKWL